MEICSLSFDVFGSLAGKKQLRHKILDEKHAWSGWKWKLNSIEIVLTGFGIQNYKKRHVLEGNSTVSKVRCSVLLPFEEHFENFVQAHIFAFTFIYLLMKCIRKCFESLMVIEAFKKNPYANQSRLNSGFNEQWALHYNTFSMKSTPIFSLYIKSIASKCLVDIQIDHQGIWHCTRTKYVCVMLNSCCHSLLFWHCTWCFFSISISISNEHKSSSKNIK